MEFKKYNEMYRESIDSPELFWKKQAERIDWFQFPNKILSTDEDGLHRWYADGELNCCHLCLDFHVKEGRGQETALIYDSPVTGQKQYFTYGQLLDKVSRMAGGLVAMGVNKGDTAIIYMPMIPAAVIAMLACARIGCIHSVVFGGFAPNELAIRIDDAKPKVLITASSGIEVNKKIPYLPLTIDALSKASHKVKEVVYFDRRFDACKQAVPTSWIDFQGLLNNEAVACTPVKATDPLYILYTSGTTGTPKGIMRDHGGYAVALDFSMEYVYNAKKGETFWAASDIGWVVGHSYIVYAPMIYGCPTVLFEGKPIKTPDASTFWRVISEHKVGVMFTAPTAIRVIRKEDPEGRFFQKYDMGNFRAQFLAGERCDVDTLSWAQERLAVPVIDHWWQTESGWPMLANMLGTNDNIPVKAGSATFPVCGYDISILDEDGQEVGPNTEGYVVAKLPLPPGTLPNLWNDTARFKSGYLNKFPGYYLSGDGGYIDGDGYVFITGRIDDVINVAGHRLSTSEMEEVIAGHAGVAECAVFGINDQIKGEMPLALFVANDPDPHSRIEVAMALKELIREQIGGIATLKNALPVDRLPKTRSGKTLRKTLRKMANGENYKIPSTIDDPQVLKEIEEVYRNASII